MDEAIIRLKLAADEAQLSESAPQSCVAVTTVSGFALASVAIIAGFGLTAMFSCLG